MSRWLRLGLTSLAIALGAVPAHALPAVRAEVTLSVEQRATSAKQPRAAPTAVHSQPTAGHPRPVHTRVRAERPAPETRPPGPPQPLFIVHRALLR